MSQLLKAMTPYNLVMIVHKPAPLTVCTTCFNVRDFHDTHHGYRSSRALPLCAIIQQDCRAAGAAARAAGGAARDRLWWAVAGALHRLVQAVHRSLLMPSGQTKRHTVVRGLQFGSRI